jgi:hypothetical protein
MRRLLIVLPFMVSACGLTDYARIRSSPPAAGAASGPTGLDRLAGKRVALLGLRIPPDLHEQLPGLDLWMEADLLRVLQLRSAAVVRPVEPVRRVAEKRIVENDLFNWFFKSDSQLRDQLEERVTLDGVELVVIASLLRFEPGPVRGSSWIRLDLQLYDPVARTLLGVVEAEGFWDSVVARLGAPGPA